jgi:aminomethyltransferase
MNDLNLKKTPLHSLHIRSGGRMVEFGGWDMPVQYTGIIEEHLAVRKAAGLFDISHMGEIFVQGPGALAFLNELLVNDAAKLGTGDGQYTLLCNERGGAIDDLYVFKLAEDYYFLIVNASRIDADYQWMRTQYDRLKPGPGLVIENRSDRLAAVALQGPNAARIAELVIPGKSIGAAEVSKITDLKKNRIGIFEYGKTTAWISRTGYTGEDGFEIVIENDKVEALWLSLMDAGQPFGLKPAGLGARDTLRTEVCYPLYGHELDEQTTPVEAGVGFFVGWDKASFIGKQVLAEQKRAGAAKKSIAFKLSDKGAPPRPHYPILSEDGTTIGQVSSGTQSPSLNLGIGLGYVPPQYAKPGASIAIEVRGKRFPAVIVAKPIYKKT